MTHRSGSVPDTHDACPLSSEGTKARFEAEHGGGAEAVSVWNLEELRREVPPRGAARCRPARPPRDRVAARA